ncbi:hypothetical protein MJO47_09380 [Desulfuromonas sp. KJ2020]|uniref:hypothetical protein n=1 Tax=Desulfuromonas sp. KJ2020 TaxID=2919173 RepID=UPI0020A7247E|nr:hypothetical protein [Desulfuromonas sp. KJ2020]MCP3177309.1 hypothetical protein [Desulfuromonas sp. KJ2020]
MRSRLQHPGIIAGRKKKLVAGVRFSLWLGDHSGEFDCNECKEKNRIIRNCHNRAGCSEEILEGKQEWDSIPTGRRPALKIPWAPTKFMACPISTITSKTWQILALINDCTSAESTDLLHMPYSGPGGQLGTIFDQPEWFRDAVRIVRAERGAYRAWKIKQPPSSPHGGRKSK